MFIIFILFLFGIIGLIIEEIIFCYILVNCFLEYVGIVIVFIVLIIIFVGFYLN